MNMRLYMQYIKRICLISFVQVYSLSFTFGSDYSEMCNSINENSLPLINIIVDYDALNTESFVNGEIEIADYQKRTDEQNVFVRYLCKLRIRGIWASNLEKKSFAVKFVDHNGEELDVNLLGIRSDENWILDAMAVDRIRMRNRICFDLWNDMSSTPYETKYGNRNGTLGEFVEVYINGEYFGLYCLTDKINRKLLNLKKYDKKTNIVHGILYKGESSRRAGHDLLSYENADFNLKSWNAWNLQYPEDYPSEATWQPLMDLIDLCSPQTSDSQFISEYQNYFYVDNIVDFLVMTTAMNVGDNVYKNTMLSTPDIQEGHRFLYSPWDMDHSLGGTYKGDYEDDVADPHRYDNCAPFDRLYGKGLDGFPEKVSKRWNELKDGVFSIEHVNSLLEKYQDIFVSSGAWNREYNKWRDSGDDENLNKAELKEDLSAEIDYVKEWYFRNYAMLCDYWRMKGDANNDGKVNVADIVEIVNYIQENPSEKFVEKNADVNEDDEIDEKDAKAVVDIIFDTK